MLNKNINNKVEVTYKTNFQIIWDKIKTILISVVTGTILLLLLLASMWVVFYFILFLAAFLFLLYIYNKIRNI